jgi:hypothetical protein
MDFTSTQARAKEVAPPPSREGGQMEFTAAKPPSASPSLTADVVDKMYHQLAEIHAIVGAQLPKCTRWHRSDQTPRSIWARAEWWGPDVAPSAMQTAPPPRADFSPQVSLWQ